jgi:hypothetical protein
MARRKSKASWLKSQQRKAATAEKRFAAMQRDARKDAKARFREQQKDARQRFNDQLRQQQREEKQRFREARKRTRHNVALLKRAGIVAPTIDARSVLPAKRFEKLFQEFAHVIEGREHTFKVTPKQAKELKEKGYTVRRGRVVLSKNLHARKGQVFQAKTAGTKSHRLETVRLGMQAPQQIRAAFASLKPEEFIGFNIYGNNSHDIYQTPDAMLEKLYSYASVLKDQVKYITIFRVKDPIAYVTQRAEQRKATQAAAETRRKAAYNKKRQQTRAGLIVNRKA